MQDLEHLKRVGHLQLIINRSLGCGLGKPLGVVPRIIVRVTVDQQKGALVIAVVVIGNSKQGNRGLDIQIQQAATVQGVGILGRHLQHVGVPQLPRIGQIPRAAPAPGRLGRLDRPRRQHDPAAQVCPVVIVDIAQEARPILNQHNTLAGRDIRVVDDLAGAAGFGIVGPLIVGQAVIVVENAQDLIALRVRGSDHHRILL